MLIYFCKQNTNYYEKIKVIIIMKSGDEHMPFFPQDVNEN